MTRTKVPTVFLDRDGVINRRIMADYVTCLAEFQLLPGVLEAIARLTRAGFRLAVVTNQRGIAVGRMSRTDVDRVHRHLSERVAELGGHLAEFYVCPHDRDEGCGCRKPDPGLLDQADRTLAVDWEASFLVGDSDSDIRAGAARGVTTVKVAGRGEAIADHYAADLPEAVAWILDRLEGGSPV